MNKLVYYDSKLQKYLLNSKWSFNFHNQSMFELLRKFENTNMFSYSNFKKEIMEVSQSIKMSIENRKRK